MHLMHFKIRSGGSDLTFLKRLTAAAGFALAVFVMQPVSVEAQGNRPQRQAQPPSQQQAQPEEEAEVEQIELTQNHIDAFIATQKEITPITAKLNPNAQPSKQMMAQMESIAKKNGFKDFDEFGDVGANIGLVFGGIDPLSKKYEPARLIERTIAAVNADKKIPAAQKKQILQELQQASTAMPTLKYPANADLIANNYDRLKSVIEQDSPPPQAPAQPQRQPARR
jgi:hypothetical protein